MSELLLQANGYRAIEEVWKASQMLLSNPKFVELIPEVGSNIVMALPGAKSRSEVCGLSGRIVKSGKRAVVTGFPELGGSKHVADVVLTAMQFDPKVRAAMNIRFSPEIIHICKGLGLVVSTFERRFEPKGVKTMQWGTRQAIKRMGKVPHVIFDRGGVGKEAMARLLGPSPIEVAKIALRLAEKIGKR
jgi:hydroxymethylpyrimidine/phosphomethylpyrimidine kinase